MRCSLPLFLQSGILFRLCGYISAECKNACSGHGQCSEFDICLCFREWQSNDCSERRCPFGISFVDSPKGDLDSSGSVSGPDELVVKNSFEYPYGTSEQFPNMRDTDLNLLDNSAHYYSECSGAGECNRKTGECECPDGFEGRACQYVSCPGEEYECSAHGTCHKLSKIAQKDYGSEYALWNKDTVKGCICDKGWFGGDCSMRRCPHGLDPKYVGDDVQTYQVPSFFFTVLTTSATAHWNDGVKGGTGYYRLQMFDPMGQGYYSARIHAGASCDDVVTAIETAPSNAIQRGTVDCYSSSFVGKNPLKYEDRSSFQIKYNSLYQYYFNSRTPGNTKEMSLRTKPAFAEVGYRNSFDDNHSTDVLLTGDLYYLQFRGNIGYMGQPEVDLFSDWSHRQTIGSDDGTVVAKMWTNGEQGASSDHFADRCANLNIRFRRVSRGEYYMWGQFVPKTIWECLGFSTWEQDEPAVPYDRGSVEHPHVARMIRHVADESAGGFFILFYWDDTVIGWDGQGGTSDVNTNFGKTGAIRVLHPFHSLDDDENVEYNMYVSKKGKAEMVGRTSNAVFKFADNRIYMANSSFDLSGTPDDGSHFSCEAAGIAKNAASAVKPCLDKNDLFFILDPYETENNPSYLNMYTAKSIRNQFLGDLAIPEGNEPILSVGETYNLTDRTFARFNEVARYHQHVITTDINTNWAHDAVTSKARFRVYKFTPHIDSTYTYVDECSNRGLCNHFEGICDCFFGYNGQACSERHSIGQGM